MEERADDDELPDRLERSKRLVADQREALKGCRRRLRETEAAASDRSDRAAARLLKARGDPDLEPPSPAWWDDTAG